MRNFSYTHLDLYEKGYKSIPIQANSVPLVRNFINDTFDLPTIHNWCEKYPDASVALVCCDNIYALDFDIDDHKVAKEMLNFMKTHYSDHLPIRTKIGHGCTRFATVFRADESLSVVSNASSYKYKVGDEKNQVELIGNRLLTIDGVHRKSGSIYNWDYPLWKIHSVDLPSLSLSNIQEIFDKYKELMLLTTATLLRERCSFTYKRVVKEETTDVFDDIKLQKKYDDGEIDEMLDMWNGDTREDWIKVGMALHSYYNGSVEGFDKWDEWSSQFEGYEGTEDCRTQWRSFHGDGGVTMGTIEHVAKKKKNLGVEKKSSETPIEFALRNYVLVASTNEVGDLSKRVNESLLPLQNMKNLKSNIKVPYRTIDKQGKEVVRYKPLISAWLEHEDRKHAYSVEYVPINTRLIKGSDFVGGQRTETYYNKYVPPSVTLTDNNNLLHYFLDHINYMFESDPEWVLNWLAQIVQQPQKRYRTILYSIATHTGTGRGWLANKLLPLIYGENNVKTVSSMAKIADSNAKNGYLDGSVLLIVNETDAPGKMKYNVGDRLKSMVSDDRQEVDVKYGKQSFNQQVYTRVFLQSNAIANLIIEHNDNRIQPFINLNPPKDKSYYDTLYGLLDNPEFINQVYSYLMKYKVNTKWLQAAKMTPEKETIIGANTSLTASAFYEFMAVVGSHCFTTKQMNYCLSKQFIGGETLEQDGTLINKKELNHLLKDHVTFSQRAIFNKSPVKVYSLQADDKLLWNNAQLKKDVSITEKAIQKHYGENNESN